MANIFKSSISGEFYENDIFFFKGFPIISYEFSDRTIAIRNFLKKFSFRKVIRENSSAYSSWIVREEDTPELMAHRIYNSPYYDWIILLFNQIINPLFEWPLSEREVFRLCETKYGVSNVYTHHHYKSDTPVEIEDLPKDIIVDSRYAKKISVTNHQYEFEINDKKREIILLKPEYLSQVLQEWENIINSEFTRVS